MRNFIPKAISEVAPPRDPYYNPANLENASTCVKEKEFTHQISRGRHEPHPADQRSGASRRHFFFRAARLGTTWPGCSATQQEPLSLIYRSGCQPAATRAVSS